MRRKVGDSLMKGHQGMLFCNCICAWQPVRVVHGDGHIRSLTRPVTVGELLHHHPHHFVCEPTSDGPLYHSGMLPLDMELEEGRIYLLLPLPRLLPHLATTFPNPPCCPCFTHHHHHHHHRHDSQDHSHLRSWLARNQSQLPNAIRKCRHRMVKSKLVRSLVRMSKSMLPERLRLRFSFQRLESFAKAATASPPSASVGGKSTQYSCSRNRWRPGLECISEVDLLTNLLRDSEVSHDQSFR